MKRSADFAGGLGKAILSFGCTLLCASPVFSQSENNAQEGNLVYEIDKTAGSARVVSVYGTPGSILEIPEKVAVEGVVYRVNELDYWWELEEGQLDAVTELVIPSTIINVAEGLGNLFPNLRQVYCNALIPPFVSEHKDYRFIYEPEDTIPLCTLHVPALTLDEYRADSCWMGFASVTGMDQNPQLLTVWRNFNLSFPSGYSPFLWLTGTPGEWFVAGGFSATGNNTRLAGIELYYNRATDYDSGASISNNTTFFADGSFSTDNAVIEMNLYNYRWTFVSFPYDVKVSEIVLPDSADMVIRHYDAGARAAVDFSRTWQDLTADSILKAYQGYIIQVRNDSWCTTLRFPSVKNDAMQNIVRSNDVTVNLGRYTSEFSQNTGWNLIGNPYPTAFDLSFTDFNGEIIYWNGQDQKYEYFIGSKILMPGEAIFVHNTEGKSSITFKAEGRVPVESGTSESARMPARRSAMSRPVFAIGPHSDWDPVNPGDPGCNLWDPTTGRVVIDYYETGYLADAIENAIGLTVGKDYLESTVNMMRGRVNEIIVTGPFSNEDICAYQDYFNCKQFDLSRTSGWNVVPEGSFYEHKLPVLVLPQCVDSIFADAFRDFRGLTDIYMFSQIPPYVDDYAFDSIPRGVVIHVPAQSYPLYLQSAVLNQMTVMPMSDQVGSISVNLPSDWTDGRYSGMKIQVTSVEFGHIQSFLVTEKQTYRFNNLVKDGTYLVELKSQSGVVLSRISDVVVKEGNAQVSFTEMLRLYNASVKVRTADGADITSSCKIRWYSSDASLLGTNYYLNSVSEGTELSYSIQIPEKYVFEYSLSDTLFNMTVTENMTRSHTLTERPKIVFRGVVTDSVSGSPLHLAAISLTQEFGDGYSKSYSTQTYADGSFSVNIVDSPVDMTVMCDGFFDKSIGLENPSESVAVKMNPLSGHKVVVDISYINSVRDGETADTVKGYSNRNDLNFSFYAEESGELTDYVVQYPYIYFNEDKYQLHEQVFTTISSSKRVFDAVETLFEITAGLDTIHAEILERGGIDIKYRESESSVFNVILFNSEGVKLRSLQESYSKKITALNLPEGSYTVVASAGKNGKIAISRLDQLSDLDLVEGQDYVIQDSWIEGGYINTVEFDTVPVLNLTNKKYLLEGSYSSDKIRVYMGRYTTMTAKAQLIPVSNTRFKNIFAVFNLPDGCEYVEGSAMLDGQVCDVTVMADRVEMALPNDGLLHEMRLCVSPTLSGNIQLNATIRLDDEGVRKQIVLGSATFKSEGISIKAPSMVNSDTITVWGTAPANSDVMLRDNGKVMGSSRADRTGKWYLRAGLENTGTLTNHRFSGSVRTPEGNIVHTDTVTCVYNKHAVYIGATSMLVGAWMTSFPITEYYEKVHNSSSSSITKFETGSYTILDGVYKSGHSDMLDEDIYSGAEWLLLPQSYVYFNHEVGEAQPMYTFGSFETQEFEFQAYFPGCDSLDVSDVVFHVELEDSVIQKLPARYKDGYWTAYYSYRVDGRLPVNASRVEYTPHKVYPEEEDPYSEIREKVDVAFADSTRNKTIDAELTESQLAILESMKGRTYSLEEFLRTVASYPESGISEHLVEWMLTVPDADASRGVFEPLEIVPGYYTPRISYSLTDGNNLFSALASDVHWSLELSDYGSKMIMKSTRGDLVQIESESFRTSRAPLIKSAGDGIAPQASKIESTIKDVTEGVGLIDNVITTSGVMTWAAGSKPFGLVEPKVAESFAGNLNVAGAITGSVGVLMELNEAKDALDRESGAGWYDLANGSQFQLGTALSEQAREVGRGMDSWNTGVAICHVALATIAITSMIFASAVAAPVTATVAVLCAIGSYLLKQQDDKFQAESQNLLESWQQYVNGDKVNDSKPNRDPSGFVYEAVEGNRLEGVTATLYQKYTVTDEYGKESEVIVPWNADLYGQINPQVTGANGEYAWDVPEGLWMVVFEKDGFVTDSTEWLGVPPPQLDVNVGLRSAAAPYVYKVAAYEEGIVIKFSKYMRVSMLDVQNIVVAYNGKVVSGEIEMQNSDWGIGTDEEYASVVRFIPDEAVFEPGSEITLFVAGRTQSYAGVPMESDFVQSFTVEREVKGMEWTSESEMRVGSTQTYSVYAYPSEAVEGRKITISNSTPLLAVISADTLSLDSCGQAQFTVTSLMTGSAQLILSMPGTDITGIMDISILPDSIYPAAPYAQYESGQLLQAGTSIALYTDSVNAEIYYTLDGSDPYEYGYLYDEPIEIDSSFVGQFTIKAAVVCGGRWSTVATFIYTVSEPVPDGMDAVMDAKAEEPEYDLNGRRIQNPQRGVVVRRGGKRLVR